jgi:hypothetical protein
LFQFNRNIDTLCFGIEAKHRNKLFRNKPKKPRKKPKKLRKNKKKTKKPEKP